MKKRVLFVDDEPMVLSGLQRMLRPMRDEWDVSFASNGEEALHLLSGSSFDAVVSDMRMPGMSGAELLQEVSRRHPTTLRFILSGFADRELVSQCAKTAHQFLSKPCPPDVLRTTISRAIALETFLAVPRLLESLLHQERWNSLPAVVREMLAPSGRRQTGLGEEFKEPALSAEMSTAIQEADARLPQLQQVTSANEVAKTLGVESLKSILFLQRFRREIASSLPADFPLAAFTRHSLQVALAARRIAELQVNVLGTCQEAFSAGLLHDLGKLVMAAVFPLEWGSFSKDQFEATAAQSKTEEELFGFNHAQLGAHLVGNSGFSRNVVEAVAFHHCPGRSAREEFAPLAAVHVGNLMVQNSAIETKIDRDYLQRIGVLEHLPKWQASFGK